MSDVQSKFDNVIERLRVLGATDDQIEWIGEQWDSLDPDVAEDSQAAADRDARREGWYRANDAILSQMIIDGQHDATEAEIDNSATPVTQRAIADHKAEQSAQESADWETLGLNIDTIVDAVGENPEIAYRLYELEQTADKPRKTLLAHLESVAWPQGKPAGDDDERNAAADDAISG